MDVGNEKSSDVAMHVPVRINKHYAIELVGIHLKFELLKKRQRRGEAEEVLVTSTSRARAP